jgi:hypothetical protein
VRENNDRLQQKNIVTDNTIKVMTISHTYFWPRLAASDKVYQLLAHGRWFSPGTLASSTTKTGRHDVAEVLLKGA